MLKLSHTTAPLLARECHNPCRGCPYLTQIQPAYDWRLTVNDENTVPIWY